METGVPHPFFLFYVRNVLVDQPFTLEEACASEQTRRNNCLGRLNTQSATGCQARISDIEKPLENR